jgi:hypothetical protein
VLCEVELRQALELALRDQHRPDALRLQRTADRATYRKAG